MNEFEWIPLMNLLSLAIILVSKQEILKELQFWNLRIEAWLIKSFSNIWLIRIQHMAEERYQIFNLVFIAFALSLNVSGFVYLSF